MNRISLIFLLFASCEGENEENIEDFRGWITRDILDNFPFSFGDTTYFEYLEDTVYIVCKSIEYNPFLVDKNGCDKFGEDCYAIYYHDDIKIEFTGYNYDLTNKEFNLKCGISSLYKEPYFQIENFIYEFKINESSPSPGFGSFSGLINPENTNQMTIDDNYYDTQIINGREYEDVNYFHFTQAYTLVYSSKSGFVQVISGDTIYSVLK